MKIHVNKKYYARGKTGKGKFAARLVAAWERMGIDITSNPNAKADIALHIGRCNYSSKAKVQVLRVGPACINTNMNHKKINAEKHASVKKADAIVYQSRYSKKIYHKLVCNPDKPEVVIFNGADPKDYEVGVQLPKNKINFLASTRVWLAQKRLKQIIRAFLEADINNSRLIVCGDTRDEYKKYERYENIRFAGPIGDTELRIHLNSCVAMIHLTFVDTCPNSVVEAQIAGCPVICTDQGGTHEILRYGKVLRDKPFKYKPVNLDKPPKIDREILIQATNDATTWNFDKNLAKDLHIDNIAKQYLTFFEKLL